MALEFALRPRISLEEPPRRRRLGRLRVPPLVLPIAAYWLGMAGVTHVLLRSTAAESAEGADKVTATPYAPEVGAEPPSPAPPPAATPNAPAVAQVAVESPPLEPAFEPAPVATPTFENKPDRAETPDPATKAETAAARRALVTRPAEPPPVTRPAPHVPERSAALRPIEEPAPARAELPKSPVTREPPARDESPATSLPSCESAAAAANETLDLRAARGAPDLTREALASVLENGAYLARCALPASTTLDICAAVRDGKVVGVSVTTQPRNAAISSCVRRAVAALRFPRSARLDVTRTRFEAAR
jgi:hypothetical protein